MNLIFNDTAVIFDKEPYTLAVTTRGIDYEKSQEVIAEIASIIDHYHELLTVGSDEVEVVNLALTAAKYNVPSSFFRMEQNSFSYYYFVNTISGRFSSPSKYRWNVRNNSFHQQWVFLQRGAFVKNGEVSEEVKTNTLNAPLAQSN
ncbi:hypothetical protein M3226_03785 [Neobacillus cucumis]|uniref:hypothetical protein n=1 Tax=Neobacillus cucumis TaxID=1740721 RepID=UPI0020405332|nr:hypothetical protein [Neobacillus cucumis]MCM3724816.1 hypothetical protein [Neobacillus cucumis]